MSDMCFDDFDYSRKTCEKCGSDYDDREGCDCELTDNENCQVDLLVMSTEAEFNTSWIKAEQELPKYYRLVVGRFNGRCELVWRAKDDDMQDTYTVYNTNEVLINLIDWIPMRKKKIKIGSA